MAFCPSCMPQVLLQNRKFIAILTTILLVLGGISWASFRVNDRKAEVKESLERAEFLITDIDILNFTDDSVFFNITGKVQGLNLTENSGFEITEFHIVLNHNTTPIELEIEPTIIEGQISGSKDSSFSFISAIGLNELKGRGSSDLIGAIISAEQVDIPFQGIIGGRTYGIRSQVSFLNQFKFRTSRTLSFNVTKIDNPESSSSKDSQIEVEITNPFTGAIRLSGQIEIGIGDLGLGVIPLVEPITIGSGKTVWSFPLMLHKAYAETLQSIMDSSNFTIWVRGDLQVFGGTESFNTTAIFVVDGGNGTLPLDWQITDFVLENYSPLTGNGIVRFNLTVINNLPLSLPIEEVEMDLATLSGTVFTTVIYNGTRVTISLYGSGVLRNVTGLLRGVNAILIGRISEDGAISVPTVRVVIFTSFDSFEVTFSIPKLELNIILLI